MEPIGIYQDLYDEKDDIPTWYCQKCYEDNGNYGNKLFEVGSFREGDAGYSMLENCPKCGRKVTS